MRKPKQSTIPNRASVALFVAMTISGGLAPSSVRAGEGSGQAVGGALPGVASREISRRLESANQADAIAMEGDRLMADGNYAAAIAKYREALGMMPVANATEVQRQSVIKRFSAAAIAQARKLAAEGDYDQARALLEEVLLPDRAPDNREAKRLLGQLDDPDRFQPANTSQHSDRVAEVTRLLQLGESHYLLGDYDKAETQFYDVLRIDHYNVAARQFLEKIERVRIDYYGEAYNHTRARMLRMVDATWESKPPLKNLPQEAIAGDSSVPGQDLRASNSDALQKIILPKVDFNETTLAEAVSFLRARSREFDPRPNKPGVNILIRSSQTVAAEATSAGDKVIAELNLTNVPLGEALRYLCEMTQMRVKIEQFAVVLVPLSENDVDLYTRSFRVPPDFIPNDGGDAAAPAAEIDPFAGGGGGAGAAGMPKRRGAKDYLASLGVPFGEGASANFDPRTTTLTVRNAPAAMELVEVIVEDSIKRQPKQVTIETKFVEVQQRNGKELGFDWLLGPAVINTDNGIVVAGGTSGNGTAVSSTDYPFINPTDTVTRNQVPTGVNPVTAGNRSGDFGVTRNAIDSILNTSIGEVGNDKVAPGILSIAGLLSEPQFQLVIRALDQKKGTDLLSAPSVTTKSGLPARIEVIREFIYPTEYDPPELPNSVGNNGNNNNQGQGGIGGNLSPASVTTFPVTPATPSAFETRNVGVTLDVDPVVGANGYTIDLNLNPEVVEFEGFINYGNPITSGAIDALGRPTTVTITENRIEMPVFSTRRVKTQVTVWDGQTVAIGGLIREDSQIIEDKVPLLGDLPLVGRLFMTKAEERFKRNLMIFVTARLIDPAGKPVNANVGDEEVVVPSRVRPTPVVDAPLFDDGLPTLDMAPMK